MRSFVLLLACIASASGFAAPAGARALAGARKAPLRSALAAPRAAHAMVIHSAADVISTLQSAADVADDFDVNTLPAPLQNLLLSPVVLAIPIGLGMTVGGAIVAFLLWSMGAF
jgi:hypothetical protein